MKAASVIVTALLAVLGCLAGFTSVLPPAAMPYIALAIGILGALSTRLLPAFVPSFIPAHVEKVLAETIGTATAVLGSVTPVLHLLPNTPPAMATWLTVVTAALGALGTALLPHEAPVKKEADEAPLTIAKPPEPAPVPPKAASWLLPIMMVAGLGTLAGCPSCAQIKQDIVTIDKACDDPDVRSMALRWFMLIVTDLGQQNYSDLLDQLIASAPDLKLAEQAVACVITQIEHLSTTGLPGGLGPDAWATVRQHAHEYRAHRPAVAGMCK